MKFTFYEMDSNVYVIEEDESGLLSSVWKRDSKTKEWNPAPDSVAPALGWEGVVLFETESEEPFQQLLKEGGQIPGL